MEFSKEAVEILKRTQADMMLELYSPNNSTTKLKGKPARTVNQADDTVSGLEDQVEDLDQILKEYDKLKQTNKNTGKGTWKCGTPQNKKKQRPLNYRHR